MGDEQEIGIKEQGKWKKNKEKKKNIKCSKELKNIMQNKKLIFF